MERRRGGQRGLPSAERGVQSVSGPGLERPADLQN